MILATGNRHKLRELRELLPGVELEPLPAGVELPPEDGDSFAANRADQGAGGARATGEAAIADDSGIDAAALGGAPGIHSARYAGEGASDEENLDKLLREVAAAGGDRRAAYVCALALVDERRRRARLRGALRGPPDRGAAAARAASATTRPSSPTTPAPTTSARCRS